MSFTGNYVCTSFKLQSLQSTNHDFDSHVFKLALYTSSATLNSETTDYTATNEISGTGYTAGGMTLTNLGASSLGTIAYASFADLVISNATLTARGGLIYNSTTGTDAIIVMDFGVDRTATAEDFTVTFPTNDPLNAIIRIR